MINDYFVVYYKYKEKEYYLRKVGIKYSLGSEINKARKFTKSGALTVKEKLQKKDWVELNIFTDHDFPHNADLKNSSFYDIRKLTLEDYGIHPFKISYDYSNFSTKRLDINCFICGVCSKKVPVIQIRDLYFCLFCLRDIINFQINRIDQNLVTDIEKTRVLHQLVHD